MTILHEGNIILLLNLTENQRQALLIGLKEMCSVFWGPNPKKCGAILQGSFFDPFDRLSLLPGFQISEALNETRLITDGFADIAQLFQHLEEAYVRLFISDRNGIAAPLTESCYVHNGEGQSSLLMGKPAIMMKKRLQSEGLSIGANLHEPPDHISIELEYLYFMLSNGWSDDDKDLVNKASTFASEVMLPWVSEFQARLAVEKEYRFYPLMTSILLDILKVIAGSNHDLNKG